MRAYTRLVSVAILAALFAAIPPMVLPSTQTTSGATSLLNPGFEAGVLNGAPASWTVVSPVGDSVKVVDAETPAEYGTYVDMGNITVQPNGGSAMLRLGTPKRGAENQNRGLNTVSQTFTSSQTSVRFAFRLFSWEHRDNDRFAFNLTSGGVSVGTLSPFVVQMASGGTRGCSLLPCSFSIDVGSSGQFIDSGWRTIDISNVPTGVPLTLSYSAGGTNSESHGTWAYFDDTTIAAVAKFSFAPVDPLEGDLIQFTDTSFNPDTSVDIVDWDWTIDGEAYDAQNPLVILPDEGTYEARLRVTDSNGTVSEIAAGQTATDGTAIPSFIVRNADPLAVALNVEALAGQPAPLLGRFADPGWLDEHSASWSITGGSAASIQEDSLAALTTGIVEGTITAASDTSGTLSVADGDGGSTTTPFNVTIVPDESGRTEPNNIVGDALPLRGRGSYLSYIQSAGDVDIFEVLLPNGQPLPAGAEVLASLRDLPADFDLALLTTAAAAGDASSLQGDAGQVGFETAAYARGAYARGAYARGAYARGAYARGAYARGAFGFANISLSDLGFTKYDGSQIGGTDISLDELGLGDLASAGLDLAGFSANRGLDDDTTLARADRSGTRIYVAVSGPNGARSASPYRLQVEVSVPLDLAELLGPEVCTGTPLVTTGATNDTISLYDNPGAARTLIVTQRERMRATYDMDDNEWTTFLNSLIALASEPTVAADIISIRSTAYDAWDLQPCDIPAANAVAGIVRDEIQARMGGIEYVVVAGSDNIVPHKRVPDETIVSNERDYVLDSFIKPGRPLFASIVQGFNLTDDYYVDAVPTDWQGRQLYLPDVPMGRLVETPLEISAVAAAYVTSEGLLDPQTASSFGYDFFADGAEAMANHLDDKFATTRLINDVWTADDLRCQFLGVQVSGLTGCGTSDVTALNAHFTHYGAFSANGFNTDDLSDFLGASEALSLPGSSLAGAIIFTMGCHAGLNVPDGDAEAPDPGLGIDPAADYPQALAVQRAILIASTGFGLGDDEGLGGTEKLLEIFSRELVSGNATAGGALIEAKKDYILSQAATTVYDEKSTIQTVLYGLPMYRVQTAAAPNLRAANIVAPAGDVTIDITDGLTTTTTSVPRDEVTVDDGTYFTAGGDYQATAGRAVQPRVALDVDATGAVAKDVLIFGATYSDIEGFNPLIARPTNEWEDGATEPQPCIESFWPAMIVRLNSLNIGGALAQKLVVTPGQFRCTSGDAPIVTGTERRYDNIAAELLRCPPGERVAPHIRTVDLRRSGTDVFATVDVSDDSGIDRIAVLRIFGGVVSSVMLDLDLPLSGQFTVTIPNASFGEAYVIQVQDGACNVAVATGKGATLNAVGVDAGPDQVIPEAAPNVFTARIEAYAGLVAPVSYVWDFGDGSFASAPLGPSDVILQGDGSATFTVQHQYDASLVIPVLAAIKVTDSAGGVGTDALVAAIEAPDGDLDDDLILDVDDNCIVVPNPTQGNTNGEILLLPKPVPVYNDHTNPAADTEGDACDGDADGDGLTVPQELARFLSPFVWDTDGDRTADGVEVACGSDPLVATSTLTGTDTDRDRLPDACEPIYGTDPADFDSDGDGIHDGVEVRYWLTNPLAVDTDGDGCNDAVEVATVNADRTVNAIDLSQIAARFGGLAPEFRSFDSNGDGTINAIDLSFTAQHFVSCPAG